MAGYTFIWIISMQFHWKEAFKQIWREKQQQVRLFYSAYCIYIYIYKYNFLQWFRLCVVAVIYVVFVNAIVYLFVWLDLIQSCLKTTTKPSDIIKLHYFRLMVLITEIHRFMVYVSQPLLFICSLALYINLSNFIIEQWSNSRVHVFVREL